MAGGAPDGGPCARAARRWSPGALQPLHLVAVVMGDQYVGEPPYSDLTELIQDIAISKVDGDRLLAVTNEVDGAAVLEAEDVVRDLLKEGLKAQPRRDLEHAHRP